MNITKNILVLISIIIFPIILKAQVSVAFDDDARNHYKYWKYRDRFNALFMVEGTGNGMTQGQVQIVDQYHDWVDCGWSKINIGADQTLQLGWYIAVLATEFKLLHDQGLSTDRTTRELWYALQAFNRLDVEAEEYFEEPQPVWWNGVVPSNLAVLTGNLNGFFLRDDVAANSLTTFPQLAESNGNYYGAAFEARFWNSALYDANNQPLPFTCIASQFGGAPPSLASSITGYECDEESIDQINHMLTGLTLVWKCVDHNVTYNNQPFLDNETSIWEEARKIVDRIATNCSANGWQLRNPETGHCVTCCSNSQICTPGGAGGYQLLAYPVAKIASMITGNPVHDYIPTIEIPTYFHVWQMCQMGGVIGTEYFKALEMAALSNEWYGYIYLAPPPIDYAQLLTLQIAGLACSVCDGNFISIPTNDTESKLDADCQLPDIDDKLLPLIHEVIYGDPMYFPAYTYLNLLNRAPCTGPYLQNLTATGGGYVYEDPFWCCTNAWLYPDRRYENILPNGINNPRPGEFNGLDYMLLHNLYFLKIYEGGQYPFYNNYDDYEERVDYPIPCATMTLVNGIPQFATIQEGSHDNPLVVASYNDIYSNKTVTANADLTYVYQRAFNSGNAFYSALGADLLIKPGSLDCPDVATFRLNGSGFTNNENQNATVNDAQFYVYPNPADNNLHIHYLNEGEKPTAINIFDLTGKLVLQKDCTDFNGDTDIDVSEIPQGMYFVKVGSAAKKFVKQ